MVLAIDIGNTHIVLGVFKNNKLGHTWRIHTKESMTEDEYFVLIDIFFKEAKIKKKEIKGIVISSVVPPLEYLFNKLAFKFFNIKPLILSAGIKTGLAIRTDNPKEVGADLIAGAVGAFNKYKQALIIVDTGTATTVTAISSKGEFLGVAIAPGIMLALEALHSRASKLPKVELYYPEKAIGKNTRDSMISGVYFGALGQIERIVKEIKNEMREDKVLVLGTGGVLKFFENKLQCIDRIEHDLVLEGLYYIYLKNKGFFGKI